MHRYCSQPGRIFSGWHGWFNGSRHCCCAPVGAQLFSMTKGNILRSISAYGKIGAGTW